MTIEPQQPQTTDHTLMGTDDAMVWAEEFCRIFNGKIVMADEFNHTEPGPVDPGTMVGWFANAMQVAVNLYEVRRIHAAGGRTEVEEFLAREPWKDDQGTIEEVEEDEDEDVARLAEALDRDEREEQERNQDQFVIGFLEGRPEDR